MHNRKSRAYLYLKFLDVLDGECAGSVSFYVLNKPEYVAAEYRSEQETDTHRTNKQLTKSWSLTNDHYTALSNEEIYTLIQNIHIRPLMQGTKDVRLFLAGAWEKLFAFNKKFIYYPCSLV